MKRSLQRLASLLAGAVLVGCAGVARVPSVPAPKATAAPDAPQVIVVKSPNDAREYRYLELPNGLKVLLASEPAADKTAASLTVFRGSFHEPAEHPGLAHFLEHMLFIGTGKYPEVDGYQAFIATNGGTRNGYTDRDHTNYYFDIDPDHFRAAMDRFAQFFIAPLLDPAYVEREKESVQSEHQFQYKEDGWRTYFAGMAALNSAHPLTRFNIGNLDTLGEESVAALDSFFRENYSGDQMGLVALSNESLDGMQAWIVPMFGAIPNRQIGAAPTTTPPYGDGDLPVTLRVRPVKELRTVYYQFPVPSTRPHYRSKPAGYITSLLGHEGEGSLYSVLKEQGWIEALGAGTVTIDDASDHIYVGISLTKSGLQRIDAITGALFDYIDLLRSGKPSEWRHAERARINDLSFRFKEAGSALGFVYGISPQLARIPPEDLLRAGYLMSEFDPALIDDYLSFLRPDNVRVDIVDPEAVTDRVEPWFDVPYALQRGPVSMNRPGFDFQLPSPNPFIAEDLEVLAGDDDPARRFDMGPGWEVWFDKDLEFRVPRANLYLSLKAPDGFASVEDVVAAGLYLDLVNDTLDEYAYPAALAGLYYRIGLDSTGYIIKVGGYTDKQTEMLRTVLAALTGSRIDTERFKRFQEERVRTLRNFASARPVIQTDSALADLLLGGQWPYGLLVDAAEELTVQSLRAWRAERLADLGLVALLHGNLDESGAREVIGVVQASLPVGPVAPYEVEVTRVNRNLRVPLEIEHDDASVVLHVQDELSGVEGRARIALALQLLQQPFHTELRTEQQLGYVVYATSTFWYGQSGISFVVQSPVASPAALERAILAFLDDHLSVLDNLSMEEFEAHKAGLIGELTERDRNLRARTERMWWDLENGYREFDFDRQVADAVAALDKTEILRFVRGLRGKARTRRVIVYNLGKFEEAPVDGELIEDVTAFKHKPN